MDSVSVTLKPSSVPTGKRAKALGAYYTPEKAVDFMIRWATKTLAIEGKAGFKIIDPSFGNGQFLKASAAHATIAKPEDQIFGIELDTETFRASLDLLQRYRINVVNLYNNDFFSSDLFFEKRLGKKTEAFDAVVGNPPFIRYQNFKGKAHALKRALEHGVKLPGHASSWAPFLVHAVSLVKPGGRLAMVVPAELSYAAYAKNVLDYLLRQFEHLSILTFQKRLFPKLGEDTYIVLGENRGFQTSCFRLIDVEEESELEAFADDFEAIGKVKRLENRDLISLKERKTKLTEYLLPNDVRSLYDDTKKSAETESAVKKLGSVAKVGIGYVTGNNGFFHPAQETINAFGIPASYLAPCIRRSNLLQGLFVSQADWENEAESEKWLLKIDAVENFETLPRGLRDYLATASKKEVRDRFKVKNRKPWYAVPHIKSGDAFLTCMSNEAPRLVHNTLGLPAPNSLHIVNLEENLYGSIDIKLLLVAWYTSLTFLSAEIEGHSLGGGMLKLEPSEAKKVLMALPKNIPPGELDTAYEQIDQRLRENDLDAALDIGDKLILRKALELEAGACELLRQGYHYLRDRRMNR